MESILVGIDGSERGERALEWAARLANYESAHLSLLAVIDPATDRLARSDAKIVRTAVDNALGAAKNYISEKYPNLDVDASFVKGDIVEALVAAADAHDMIVLGSHRSSTLSEKVYGAKGLRVSVSASVPTVVVPADWSIENAPAGVVVGVGPDDVSGSAIEMGVRLALASKQPLELVSAWGIPALLSRSAELMGGGLAPVGEEFQANLDAHVAQLREKYPELEVTGNAIEGPSPTQVLLERSKDCGVLVLGTHSRGTVSRALFGSVTYGAIARLQTPTVVVPQEA